MTTKPVRAVPPKIGRRYGKIACLIIFMAFLGCAKTFDVAVEEVGSHPKQKIVGVGLNRKISEHI